MSKGAYHQEQRVAHKSAAAESCVPLQPVRSGAQVHAHDVCHREDDNARKRRRIQHHPHLRIMQPYITPLSILIPLGVRVKLAIRANVLAHCSLSADALCL